MPQKRAGDKISAGEHERKDLTNKEKLKIIKCFERNEDLSSFDEHYYWDIVHREEEKDGSAISCQVYTS